MSYQTKAAELRLLADDLRRIKDQRVISLAQAQEVCGRLGEIIWVCRRPRVKASTRAGL